MTTGQTPPRERHTALRPLSREHMGGLIVARDLCRAAEESVESRRAAVAKFTEAWRREIRDHFNDEERLLLPLTQSPALRDRLVAEHLALREHARRCETDADAVAADPASLSLIGSLLHDHIRWEEREYFEVIQRDHPEALEALGHEADRIEQRRPGARARRTLK